MSDIARIKASPRAIERPLRVWHLSKYYPPVSGGIETHVRALAAAQAECGAEVSVLAIEPRTQRERPVAGDGDVRVVRVPPVLSIAKLDVAPRLIGEVRRIVQSDPDVIHVHLPNPAMLLALATAPRGRATLVATWHSDVIRQRLRAAVLGPVERLVLRRAATILTTSPQYGAASKALRGVGTRIDVLPLGIDLAPFTEVPERVLRRADELRDRFGGPLWLTVGRLVYYKGIDVAIRALRELPGTLVVIGSGPLRSSLENVARDAGVAERVHWAGEVSDEYLRAAYLAATALLFPSVERSEAFGLVQLEAMASGCAVVNTDIPGSGVPWVCRHEESGLTVPPRDPVALAEAARRLMHDESLRARLSANGRARVREHFSSRAMAQRSLVLYEQCRQRS